MTDDATEIAGAPAMRDLFFVYIIESPSAPDLYRGRSEGGLVAQALSLEGIPCVVRTAISPEAFWAALRLGLPEAMEENAGRRPMIHISAHGDSDGIQLSSGTAVKWDVLRDLLVPVNESLNGTLVLCMSACQGFSACRMAMQGRESSRPFYVMVGNAGTPTWSDTVVAYLAFYHLLAKGDGISAAVDGMNAASGDQGWIPLSADEIQQRWIDSTPAMVDTEAAQSELEALAAREVPSESAKALESGGRG